MAKISNNPAPPSSIDIMKPSVARMYDFYLGGKNNFASDRAAVLAAKEANPQIFEMAIEGRHFLRRVIRYMCYQGIDQFIDIGSGLPSADNTHQIAQRVIPDARVVYVDIDEAAVIYGQQILSELPTTTFIHGSVLELDRILRHQETKKLIDFSKPVGVVMMGLLHFFSIDTGRDIFLTLRNNLAPGSMISISHGITDNLSEDIVQKVLAAYARTPTPLIMRPLVDVEQIIQGFEAVEPGVTLIHEWKPELAEERDTEPPKTYVWGGVVVKV
ncbi:DUF574 domain-containing protein [Trichoderma austrokoningii]